MRPHPYRFLIHDRDSSFSSRVDETISGFGIRPLKTPHPGLSPLLKTAGFGSCGGEPPSSASASPSLDEQCDNGHMRRSDTVERLRRVFAATTRDGVVAAYLFGSEASDRAHSESDVDVGVLLDHQELETRRARFDRGTRLASALMAQLGTDRLDVVVLNDAPPLFARRIVLEGVRLVCTDPEAEHAFVRDVQLRAADLEPFLRRMRAIKLDALAPR